MSIRKVEDLLVTSGNDSCRYSKILDRYEKEVEDLKMRIEILETQNRTKIKPKLDYVIPLINNMVMYMRDSPLCVKIKLIGLIFPEKIEFDGKHYRTEHVNSLVDVKSQQNNELENMSEQKKTDDFSPVYLCAPNRTVLEPILRDLDRLYEMRFWIPDPTKPVTIEWLKSQGLI